MSVLSTLPPAAVLPLEGLDARALRAEAAASGQRWLQADCAGATTKAEVMAALASGLRLPAYFGGNLDALYDCLTDLKPRRGAAAPGLVLLLEGLPQGDGFDASQHEALMEVLRDAADDFAGRGIGFRVFYALSAARPASP